MLFFGERRAAMREPQRVFERAQAAADLVEPFGKLRIAFAIGGGTYSRCMPNTVAFGPCFPGDVDTCHMPDEWFSLENMMLSIRIMAHAIVELAGKVD